jgi:hypothetical protein
VAVVENTGECVADFARGEAIVQLTTLLTYVGDCEGAVLLEDPRGDGGFGSTTNGDRPSLENCPEESIAKRMRASSDAENTAGEYDPGTPDDWTARQALYEPVSPPVPPPPHDADKSESFDSGTAEQRRDLPHLDIVLLPPGPVTPPHGGSF